VGGEDGLSFTRYSLSFYLMHLSASSDGKYPSQIIRCSIASTAFS